eukprot:gene21536-1214_t
MPGSPGLKVNKNDRKASSRASPKSPMASSPALARPAHVKESKRKISVVEKFNRIATGNMTIEEQQLIDALYMHAERGTLRRYFTEEGRVEAI